MRNQKITIDRITIAVTNLDKMIKFYKAVFQCDFIEKTLYGTTLYMGVIAGVQIQLCPNKLAKVKAEQNRQQFHFFVENLGSIIDVIMLNNGIIKGEVTHTEEGKAISILDPDGNTIVFVERIG